MTNPRADVAVIGAGATGCALVVQLLRQLPAGSTVIVLGTPGETARGVAYGTALPVHLLNVRAGRMSAIHDDPGHFVRWLVRSGVETAATASESYQPRPTYGRYLADTLYEEIAAAGGRVTVTLCETSATDIVHADGHYVVGTADGRTHTARAVALCLGHGRPGFPIPAGAVDPAARSRMIDDPWGDPRMAAIAPEDRVLMVGTGLTMVDQVLALQVRGHRGTVTAISRRGHVPTDHLVRRTEPALIDLPEGPVPLRRLVRLVIAATRRARREGGDWRAIIDGLRPVTQDLWQQFSLADKRRFNRHLESLWSIVRHRMAPEVAARLARARADGRLTIRAARVTAVQAAGGHLSVGLRPRGTGESTLADFDWMLNCSGTGRIVVGPETAPIGTLVATGSLRADPLGRGIAVAPSGAALGGEGTAPLHVLGPPGAGVLLEITAMPDIREQCAEAAGEIAASLERAR